MGNGSVELCVVDAFLQLGIADKGLHGINGAVDCPGVSDDAQPVLGAGHGGIDDISLTHKRMLIGEQENNALVL